MPPALSLTRLAIIANLAAAALLAASFGMSHRLGAGADEVVHFDYAYQVWLGRLPVFENGLVVDPPWGSDPAIQWTAVHPPLFYLLLAPFIGPLVDGGNYVAAGYVARMVCALIASALVAAVMWLAREVAPSRPWLWLAAGSVAAVNPPVAFAGGTIYNDNLMLVFTTLLIAVTVRMLRLGASAVTLALFGLFTAGALWVRFTSLMVVGLCGLALGAAWVLRRTPAWRPVLGLGITSLAAVASIAWFYLHNRELTGNFAGTRPNADFSFLRTRVHRPFFDVLVDPAVWRSWHGAWGYELLDPLWVAAVLVGVPLVVAAVLTIRRLRVNPRRYEVVTVLILAGLVVGIILVQTDFRANRGGGTWRYMKPLLPAMALGIAWALTASRRLVPLLIPAWHLIVVGLVSYESFRVIFEPNGRTGAPSFLFATCVVLLLAGAAVATSCIAVVRIRQEAALVPETG